MAVNISADTLLELTNSLTQEQDTMVIIEKVIRTAQDVCNADGATFYTVNDDNFLRLVFSYSKSLKIHKIGSDNKYYTNPTYLPDQRRVSPKSIIVTSALNKEIINTPDIYAENFDNSIYDAFDKDYDYRSVSMLVIPVLNHKGNIIGVAQFINAMDLGGRYISFTSEVQKNTQSVCNLLAPFLESHKLSEDYASLLESFIEVLGRAVDAKSPFTGIHCKRVPVIARMLAMAAVQTERGPLKNFEMSDDDWYALHIASWLHDCGKVTTPEYIVNKATKLETINNRIHEIRNRFEILRRDAHIDYLKKRLQNTDTQENLQKEFVARVRQLEDDYEFIARCNIGDIPMTEDDIARLENIAKIRFMRYFNRMLGLSWAERNSIADTELYSHPSLENLIQNREDQVTAPYNHGELYNLRIRNGTINKQEREKINEHIVVTIDMLKALPFPKELSNVVEYAGSHHERIDGKGYPNGLTGSQMSIPAKIMAIADIFEALTSTDRPYKEPKKLSSALAILKELSETGHIDRDLYEVFVSNKVYEDYAEQYMNPEQIDDVNPEDYL
ncbi:MAG: HD domain-containing protein [Alphaproteobacteria bacterium]|nr:HD domain-containing protein [Alphaproteobacteria bacterium]